jgi:hypothetical protein
MDVSSANNLHKPIVSSAMSLINIKKRKGLRMDPWGTPALRIPNALIYKFQSGFLPGHSTTHQLIKEICMALDNRELICVSSAMSLINIKKRKGLRMDPWGTPALRIPFPEITFFFITCCSLAEI